MKEDDMYYMFVKSERNPANIILLKIRESVIQAPMFKWKSSMKAWEVLERGLYEAPTSSALENGKWCLFLGYYGVPGAGQGYVPFIAK